MEIVEFGESIDVVELLDSVGMGKEEIEFGKFLAIVEVLKQVIVDLQALHHVLGLETEGVDLPDLIMAHI